MEEFGASWHVSEKKSEISAAKRHDFEVSQALWSV